ncbi:MgtC/SapB family protein, partial [Empedobacter sp.]
MEEFLAKSIQNELILICISIIIGVLIGTEREYRNKSAGLRTFILVSFGSCLFTILSIRIGVGNPDRLAANIITGIGFLGAG